MVGIRFIAVGLITVISIFITLDVQAAEKKALVGGRLIDGLLGPPIANSVILVEGESIVAVGTTATLDVLACQDDEGLGQVGHGHDGQVLER